MTFVATVKYPPLRRVGAFAVKLVPIANAGVSNISVITSNISAL